MSSDTRPTPARLKRLKEWCEPGKEGLAQTEAAELFVEIEALEGEVETLKICIDAHEVASELGESMNEQLHREVQSLSARAERLRVALSEIAANADAASDYPLFRVQVRDFARAAIRAAAGEEGK